MVLGFGKKGPSGVGCYGKLPLHGDYVSHQNDGPEARTLASWLDSGYRITAGDDDREAAELLFVLPGKRAIFGGIWPSADASGTRRFPFTLFATASGKDLAEYGAALPLALERIWLDMAKALPDLREAPAPDRIQARVGAIPVPLLPDPDRVHGRFVADQREEADVAPALPVLVDVTRLADALAGGRKELPNFAIRIPLRTDLPPLLEASGWLEVLSRRMNAAELAEECHIFIRPAKGDREGDLFVIHRELRPDDLAFLLRPTEDYAYGNLLGGEPDEAATEVLAQKLAAETGDAAPTLGHLLAMVGKP